MPKPNRVLVGDVWYVMDPEYLAGARAARGGYATGRGTASWRAGERNEIRLEHVRFGIDLLGVAPGARDFQEDPDVPRLPRAGGVAPPHPDTACLAYMEVTGSLSAAAAACRDNDWLPDSWRWADPAELDRIRAEGCGDVLMRPARLRGMLAARGVPVSLDMAKALLRRLEHERRTRAVAPGFRDGVLLDGEGPEARLLLASVARLQFRDWLSDPLRADVEALARRPRGWAEARALRLAEAGLDGFAVLVGGDAIRLGPKGCGILPELAPEREAPRVPAFA